MSLTKDSAEKVIVYQTDPLELCFLFEEKGKRCYILFIEIKYLFFERKM